MKDTKMNMECTANKPPARPHNCYNIFFILERGKLIRESQGSSGERVVAAPTGEKVNSSFDLTGYYFLRLPDLPPRYKYLTLSHDWYVPGKNGNRKHVKNSETHGLTSFVDLAKTVASNWKAADNGTKDYCKTVARILKERYGELTQIRGIYLPTKDSNDTRSTEKGTQKKSAKKRRHHQQQQRKGRMLSMPNFTISNTATVNQWNLPRSSSLGNDQSLCVPCGITMSAPAVIYPVTPESANKFIHTNSVQQQQWKMMLNMATMPSPSAMNQGRIHCSSSLGDGPGPYNLDVGLRFPIVPFSSTKITGEVFCSFISEPATPNYRGSNNITEVDVSDSDIRSMWTSNCF